MKNTKSILSLFAILILLFAALPSVANASGPLQATLIAGQDTPVGTVTIDDDGTYLTVTYNITVSGYCLDKTHVYAATTAPKKAAPGSFPYSHTNLGCATSDSYMIPLSDLGVGSGEQLYIAAHADVLSDAGGTQSGLADLVAAIESVSNPIQMTITNVTPSGPARWQINISGAGTLDGTYDGWCADPPNPFVFNVPYDANMSVSLSDPWDKVNYIVNHYQVGDISPTTGSPYSTCDIQQAIHYFLHGYSLCTANINQTHIDEIIADANANGAGFVPGCGQLLAVLLDAVDSTVQDQIILIPVPCVPVVQEDTAWAFVEGATQFDKGWGWYFTYTTN